MLGVFYRALTIPGKSTGLWRNVRGYVQRLRAWALSRWKALHIAFIGGSASSFSVDEVQADFASVKDGS